MSDYAKLEAEAIQRKKYYCTIEGICYICWEQDPVCEVYLDSKTGCCPNCDQLRVPPPKICPNCAEATSNSYDEEGHCSAYCARKGPNKMCWGCKEDQPNQLAHMDPGGCLYSED